LSKLKTTLVPAAEANKLIHGQWLDAEKIPLASGISCFSMREFKRLQILYLYVKNRSVSINSAALRRS
jgi:hypothetical protein